MQHHLLNLRLNSFITFSHQPLFKLGWWLMANQLEWNLCREEKILSAALWNCNPKCCCFQHGAGATNCIYLIHPAWRQFSSQLHRLVSHLTRNTNLLFKLSHCKLTLNPHFLLQKGRWKLPKDTFKNGCERWQLWVRSERLSLVRWSFFDSSVVIQPTR